MPPAVLRNGYCHARADWAAGFFRDCNTLSNGQPVPLGVLQREYIERLAGRVAAGNTLLGLTGGWRIVRGVALIIFHCRLTRLEDRYQV